MSQRNHTAQWSSALDIYSVQPRLVWATEREIEAHFQQSVTSPDQFTTCWLLIHGQVRVQYSKELVSAKAGEWLLLSEANGYQNFAPGSRLISLRFDLRLRGGEPLFSRQRSRVIKASVFPDMEISARALLRRLSPSKGEESHLISRRHFKLAHNFGVEAAFLNWVAAYVDMMEAIGATQANPAIRDERIDRALTLIEKHPMHEKFSEKALAKACGLSINQFARLFQRAMSVSAFDYYDQRRLELAKHALDDTTLQIKEIAFELGFSSSPHFSNWFTNKEKLSPRTWRVNKTKSRL